MNKNGTVRRFYSQYILYGNEIQLLQPCAARFIL